MNKIAAVKGLGSAAVGMVQADLNAMVNFVGALPHMAPAIFHEVVMDAEDAVSYIEEVFTNPQAAETQAANAIKSVWTGVECVFKDCAPTRTLLESCASVSSVLAKAPNLPATAHVTTTVSTSVPHASASTQATRSVTAPSNTGTATVTTTAKASSVVSMKPSTATPFTTPMSVIVTYSTAQTVRTVQIVGSAAAIGSTHAAQGDGSRVVPFGISVFLSAAFMFGFVL